MSILECKKQIENLIVQRMSKISNVESIFVVGSMASDGYCEKELNDYDIRILVSTMDDDFYVAWNETIEECLSLASQFKKIKISFCDIIGPAKVAAVEIESNLMIHGIVLTQEALDGLGNIHKKSYYNLYNVLYGRDPIKQFESLQIDIGNILYDHEGINYCIDHLLERKLSFMKWIKDDDNYRLESYEEDFTDESGYEFVCYSIKKAIMNISEYYRDRSTSALDVSKEIKEKIKIILELEYIKYLLNKDVYLSYAIQILDFFRRELLKI